MVAVVLPLLLLLFPSPQYDALLLRLNVNDGDVPTGFHIDGLGLVNLNWFLHHSPVLQGS